MITFSLNLGVGFIGLTMMLVGLLVNDPDYTVFSTSLTSVGGSVLATALVNWILTRNLVGVTQLNRRKIDIFRVTTNMLGKF